jgi:20S proteasome subunit alpha 2
MLTLSLSLAVVSSALLPPRSWTVLSCRAWKASAIGKNSTNAKTFLEKRYNPEMELEDAINTAILTLKEGFEGAITEANIEIAVVGADRKFRVLSQQEIADYVKEVE